MHGHVVTKAGTFGVVERSYRNEAGEPCVVLSWGPLHCRTPVFERNCHQLTSRYETEARAEAEAWLADLARPDRPA